ncbi:MAG: heavy metal translocating P-type ATPase [Bacillota bacterium]|nr:heavy metal translocating P-type ATPase [Bacillota bacterium]
MNKEKIYILEGLDCANCAAKMESKIQELPGIHEANLVFATKQLKIVADDPDSLVPQMQKICSSIEGQVELVPKEKSISSEASQNLSASGHGEKGFWRSNSADIISIAAGALLFAVGLIADMSFYLTLAVCGAAYLILGWNVLFTAVRNICRGQVFDENFLMAIATVAAFCIGDFAEGAGVMLFYRIGEFFEHVAVEKSRTQIMDAVDMRPETVNLLVNESADECECGCGHDHEHEHEHFDDCGCGHDHENSEVRVIPAGEAKPGDILLVRPGDRIPLDGIIVDGESRIDTSPVTGEPVPVKAVPETEVISGCVNIQGLLKLKVTKPLSESMVTRILDTVETAAAGKPKIDKFITKFARVYTPIVVILAILTAIIPSLITGEWSFWITTAITFLVISCPCALVISVPLAFFAGIGAASKLGILFKGGISIEALRKIKAVVMDKTGTLTNGNFTVQKIITADGYDPDKLLSLAAACESASTHPVAASITDAAADRSLKTERPLSIEEIAGKGIKAVISEGTVLCGNATLLRDFDTDMGSGTAPDDMSAGTKILVALNGQYIGTIFISDTIKPDASEAVSQLMANGLTPAMLTGDSEAGARAVAAKTGISNVFAGLLPEGKLNALYNIRKEYGPVMFVGDGINDAPVLAGADVGAAMGSGADAAIEAADVVFMSSSVSAIPQSIKIASATGRIAMQNVVFALAIKLLVILMGFAGFANIWAAVFADTGVAMLCILNSLRLLWKKF